MKKTKRLFAVLLIVLTVVVMLSSAVYIAAQSDHDCVGNDCQICCHMASCQHVLRQAALTGGAVSAAAAMFLCVCGGLSGTVRLFTADTLVSSKVKLSN